MTVEHAELSISRIIQAPRAVVWSAWAEKEHFEKWWIPEPMICKVMKMDMNPGGGFETRMSEDGNTFQPHVEGCFLEIVPQRRLVFTTALTESWKPNEPWLALTAIISMEDEGEATKYSARVLHKTPEDSRKHQEMGFEKGWGTCIDQLGKLAMKLA
ncbi:SRPBCC family protein [Microbulbifer litoralis]|uniref:SRPBCC family protein n=1 Tax=Microbulbifer litoralis TaxID=2933965 RepID=UPI00202950A6|nr:SRPBCC family protein [Microbulbifer sp. GX H0434]